MKIDKVKFKKFFIKNLRKNRQLSYVENEDFNIFLNFVNESINLFSLQQWAYVFATVNGECKFRIRKEKYNGTKKDYFKKYVNRNGNKNIDDAIKYAGKGYVQLTFRNNYIKLKREIEVDIVSNSELALIPKNAFDILVIGMKKGLFSGARLDRYINDNKKDYYHARKVVNGMSKADKFADEALKFELVLRKSIIKEVKKDYIITEKTTEIKKSKRIIGQSISTTAIFGLVANNISILTDLKKKTAELTDGLLYSQYIILGVVVVSAAFIIWTKIHDKNKEIK